jgi:hypothetical protein
MIRVRNSICLQLFTLGLVHQTSESIGYDQKGKLLESRSHSELQYSKPDLKLLIQDAEMRYSAVST